MMKGICGKRVSNRKKKDKTLIEIGEYRHKEMTNGIVGMFAFLMALVFLFRFAHVTNTPNFVC